MPDDAIERARQIMIEELRKTGCRGVSLDPTIQPFLQAGVRACLAFASQQAPEGWRELATTNARKMIHGPPAIQDEGRRWWTNELSDAAPSVTLGEVG